MPGSSSSSVRAAPRPSQAAALRFGDCVICRQTHVLIRQGQPLPIRRKAFDVLLLLIDQRPQTLSHERIAREVWANKALGAKHIARAVMELRQAIGDDAESPRFIVSVRGVGYRFAGDVTQAALGPLQAADEPEEGVQAVRADIDGAAACLRNGDFEEARRLVDRAIAGADLADARPDLARALALAASILLRIGSHDHALALATQSMRIAQSIGQNEVLADARLGLAEVQLWMGSAHAALDHLLAVHRVLYTQAPSLSLWRCESLLGEAYREIGRLEEAWPWCERAEASALHLAPETRALRERLVKVAVLHFMTESADEDGRADEVQACGLRALALLDQTEPDARAIGSSNFELVSQTYRAVTLEAMGRLEEGWAVIEALRPVLFRPGMASTPWLEFRRKEFRQSEAGLLSRSGRAIEAIQAIEQAIADAPTVADSPMEPSKVQALAARICERAGRYQEALVWMRRQQRSLTKVHADRAQATAGIVRAQLESDRLGEELVQAQAAIERLTRLNQELQRRIVQMDRHTLLDEGGLVPAEALAATIDARAALARARELPLCIGIVECAVAGDADVDASLLAMRRRAKLLSSALRAVIPEASAAAQWRPGVYFFIISDMGLGPARQRCQALAQRMNGEVVPTTVPEPVVSFRADAVDITRFSGIEAALGQLPSVSWQLPASQ